MQQVGDAAQGIETAAVGELAVGVGIDEGLSWRSGTTSAARARLPSTPLRAARGTESLLANSPMRSARFWLADLRGLR